jgi:hypothetical protein
MRSSIALAALALGLFVPGCSQEHLSAGFGRAQRAAFQAQPVRPAERARPPTLGLDTQEADVVARSYVQGLAGKGDRAEPEPILLVAPQRQGQPARLAPSVPKE